MAEETLWEAAAAARRAERSAAAAKKRPRRTAAKTTPADTPARSRVACGHTWQTPGQVDLNGQPRPCAWCGQALTDDADRIDRQPRLL